MYVPFRMVLFSHRIIFQESFIQRCQKVICHQSGFITFDIQLQAICLMLDSPLFRYRNSWGVHQRQRLLIITHMQIKRQRMLLLRQLTGRNPYVSRNFGLFPAGAEGLGVCCGVALHPCPFCHPKLRFRYRQNAPRYEQATGLFI